MYIAERWTFVQEQWKRDWAACTVVWQLLLSLEYQPRSMVANMIKQIPEAPDSYSRKLGPFKAMWSGIEGNRRLLGMFSATFSD